MIHNKEKTNRQVTSKEPFESESGKMPIYECWCGTKILVVPDLFEMARAIKNHQVEHKRLTGERLSEDKLIQEILNVIVKS